MKTIKIANKNIGENEPCFIIAEAGSNHDGDLDQAKKLIEIAAESGADAVKFQSFEASELFQNPEIVEKIEKLEINRYWYDILFEHAEKNDIILFFSVFDEKSLKTLENFETPAYKIASYELMHFPLLKSISKTKKPLIISTGMADNLEVKKSVDYVNSKGLDDLILLHCVSQYPAEPKNVNLKSINALKKFNYPVGFSDHTLGIYGAIAAVALGANVIEKHFTINQNLEGPDHSYALGPPELKEMIKGVREVEAMLGQEQIVPSEPEILEKSWRRGLYARRNISKGVIIHKEDIKVLRPSPEGCILPTDINSVIGKKTIKQIVKGELIKWETLE